MSEKNITVLPADEAPEVPEGFAETTIQLNGDYKVEGWVWESDTEQRYCVVYGMNENGEKGLYRYDIGEKTIQRYFEDPAVKSSYSDEEVEAFIQEYNDMNQLYRLRLIIIIALGAVCVILIIMVIVLLRKKAGGNGSEHPHDPGVQNPGGSRRQPDALAQHLPERAARERFGQNTVKTGRKDAKPQQSVRRGRSHPAVRFLRQREPQNRKRTETGAGQNSFPESRTSSGGEKGAEASCKRG